MMNQSIKQRNFDNRATTEIPPAQRVYAFKDLPPETQENLLRLQDTDGDFLKISSGETERRIVLLVFVLIAIVGLAAIVADASLDLKRIVVFSADAVLCLLWFVHLFFGICQAFGSPIKNRIYIAPTQVIETLDRTVRFRELKDASEISVNKFATDIGRRNKLDVKFNDGDAYQLYIPGMTNSKQIDLMREWQEKATVWKNEAISASQRGDANYFASHDIISKLSETNTSVLSRQNRSPKENLLLILTIVLIAANGGFLFFLG